MDDPLSDTKPLYVTVEREFESRLLTVKSTSLEDGAPRFLHLRFREPCDHTPGTFIRIKDQDLPIIASSSDMVIVISDNEMGLRPGDIVLRPKQHSVRGMVIEE